MGVAPCVVDGGLNCEFYGWMNLLSNPEVEEEVGAGGVTIVVVLDLVVVGGKHDGGGRNCGRNLIKHPLKGWQR